jgi:Flp pilus assembly pilin Flp
MKLLIELLRNEDGANLVEYGIIAVLISVMAIGSMIAIGIQVDTFFTSVENGMNNP